MLLLLYHSPVTPPVLHILQFISSNGIYLMLKLSLLISTSLWCTLSCGGSVHTCPYFTMWSECISSLYYLWKSCHKDYPFWLVLLATQCILFAHTKEFPFMQVLVGMASWEGLSYGVASCPLPSWEWQVNLSLEDYMWVWVSDINKAYSWYFNIITSFFCSKIHISSLCTLYIARWISFN